MKKIIFIILAFISLSAGAEVAVWDEKESKDNVLLIDEAGLYRYKSTKYLYQKECKDIYSEVMKEKCLIAEKAAWERNKSPEEIAREGSLFTGKILVHFGKKKAEYFYVDQGKKGKKIHLLLNRYYFEKGLLYDIKTEEPVSDDVVIGGVEGLTENKNGPRFIIQQKYENGQPVSDPIVVPVK